MSKLLRWLLMVRVPLRATTDAKSDEVGYGSELTTHFTDGIERRRSSCDGAGGHPRQEL